jgi:hypothetical protein
VLGPTSDHGEIIVWATRHNAFPVELKRRKSDGEPNVLRFIFGEEDSIGTEELRSLTWEEFFARFDLLRLALVYDDTPDFQIIHLATPKPFDIRTSPA